MSRVKLENLVGDEILGKEIVSEQGVVLIPAGTRIKPIYIEKLSELGVKNVFIRDEKVSIDYRKTEIITECKTKVKELLQRHFYSDNSDLKELEKVAADIMDEALDKPEVILNVDNIYHNSEDIYLHSVNVCTYSILIALKMKIPKKEIIEIAVGALLHDIGYNYVNAELINHNVNKHNEKAIKESRKHVVYGYSEVQNEKWLSNLSKDIILLHHEREDGSGYPFKRKGNTIPLGCKIVALCNEFDNRINGKNGQAEKVYLAIENIVAQTNTGFCYKVVETFKNTISAYPNGTLVLDNYGDVSVVMSQNNNFPTRPVLKVIKCADGSHKREGEIKDLTRELTVFIEDTLD